jgi:hypothetical protein
MGFPLLRSLGAHAHKPADLWRLLPAALIMAARGVGLLTRLPVCSQRRNRIPRSISRLLSCPGTIAASIGSEEQSSVVAETGDGAGRGGRRPSGPVSLPPVTGARLPSTAVKSFREGTQLASAL